MSNAQDDDLRVIIPNSLKKNLKRWSPADVLNFLEANKDAYFLSDKNIEIIRTNEVAGLDFLELTKEMLLQSPFKLPYGAAARIEYLIKKLNNLTKEEAEPAEQAKLTTEDVRDQVDLDFAKPPYTYHQSPGLTHKSKSSSMSAPCNQACSDIKLLLENELSGAIWRGVRFYKLFGDPSTDIHTLMIPFTEWWLGLAKSKDVNAFGNYGAAWFMIFCNMLKSGGLLEDHAEIERFYYSASNLPLGDAYHGAQRKCDIMLTHKLNQKSHVQAIGGSAITGNAPVGVVPCLSGKYRHSWKDVLVVGEFKANFKEDRSKDMVLQLSSYAREVFGAQPGRRFFHAFSVCGHLARFYFFDRVGVSISTTYDISSKEESNLFMHGLLTYMQMTASQLGFDHRYKDIAGNIFLPNGNGNNPKYLHLNDKRFVLLKTLHQTPAIVSRGTLCWLAREEGCVCTKGCNLCLCVVKEAWRDTNLNVESELWQVAKKNNVFGCLDVLFACDVEVASRERVGQNPNNVRNDLDYSEAELVRQWLPPNIVDIDERNNKAIVSAETTSQEAPTPNTHHQAADNTVRAGDNQPSSPTASKKITKKRSSSQAMFLPSKRSKKGVVDVVEVRTRSFLVVRNVGKKLCSENEQLHCSLNPKELVEVLRDAIICHRSLYENAGILHCDISVNNIMIAQTPMGIASNLKGFLIDLDYAQRHTDPPRSACATGTAPFMALELLLKENVHHTWRHDLESFLYVLIWSCTHDPYRRLDAWVKALESKNSALAKYTHIISEFFEDVLNGFHPKFQFLKDLALRFKEILFKKFEMSTPGGDETRNEIYQNVIQAFDDCIVKLMEEHDEDWERVEADTSGKK